MSDASKRISLMLATAVVAGSCKTTGPSTSLKADDLGGRTTTMQDIINGVELGKGFESDTGRLKQTICLDMQASAKSGFQALGPDGAQRLPVIPVGPSEPAEQPATGQPTTADQQPGGAPVQPTGQQPGGAPVQPITVQPPTSQPPASQPPPSQPPAGRPPMRLSLQDNTSAAVSKNPNLGQADNLNLQENPYDAYTRDAERSYIEAIANAIADARPSASMGLGLQEPAPTGQQPGGPLPAPAQPQVPMQPGATTVKASASDVASLVDLCKDPGVVEWAKRMATSGNANSITSEINITEIRSATELARSLDIGGSVNINLIKGISGEGRAEFKSAMNFNSDSRTLFIDSMTVSGPVEALTGFPVGSKEAVQATDGDRKEQCGDRYVATVARGSRFSTTLNISVRNSTEGTGFGGSVKLDGLQIGSVSAGGSAKLDMRSLATQSTSDSRDRSFLQTNSGLGSAGVLSAPCKLLIATVLPFATRATEQARRDGQPAPIVAFALNKYPTQTFNPRAAAQLPHGASGMSVAYAASYIYTIEQAMKLAGEMWDIYRNRALYVIDARKDPRIRQRINQDFPEAFQQLTGMSINERAPQDVWIDPAGKIDGLIGAAIQAAAFDIAMIENATPNAETNAADHLKAIVETGADLSLNGPTGARAVPVPGGGLLAVLDRVKPRAGAAARPMQVPGAQAAGVPLINLQTTMRTEFPAKVGGALFFIKDEQTPRAALITRGQLTDPKFQCNTFNTSRDPDIVGMNARLNTLYRGSRDTWRSLGEREAQNMKLGIAGFLQLDESVSDLPIWVYDGIRWVIVHAKTGDVVGKNANAGDAAHMICFRTSQERT